ncbi:LysR family transcriptional regulator [Pantoea rwandensis]|uniref:LysR family transcriptional regulator n=1 Tax=Pantoea rwandensis TaxID=1076550 RepID=A0A1X1D0P3_9GAMM|nr:LysR family transcriptional regulator [Pantoea rwandensis]ORM70243.1 LysR family transcriptional regulator [Pantoea rwandensis]
MRSKIDLNVLRVFVTVAEKGSFIGGARALNMPASNVSRQISQLEERLGMRLLQRSTRHMKLTDAGQMFFDSMRPLLDSVNETEARLSHEKTEPEGLLRVCLPSGVGPVVFGNLLADFALRYPKIELHCMTNLQGADALWEDCDVVIDISRGARASSDVIAQQLVLLPCQIVAAPTLLQRFPRPTHTEQLLALPCITTVSALQGQAWQFLTAGKGFRHINVTSPFRVDSGEMALQAALKGVGFAILSAQACEPYIRDGRLEVIELELTPAPLEIALLYQERSFLPARSRAFIDFLQEAVRNQREK